MDAVREKILSEDALLPEGALTENTAVHNISLDGDRFLIASKKLIKDIDGNDVWIAGQVDSWSIPDIDSSIKQYESQIANATEHIKRLSRIRDVISSLVG